MTVSATSASSSNPNPNLSPLTSRYDAATGPGPGPPRAAATFLFFPFPSAAAPGDGDLTPPPAPPGRRFESTLGAVSFRSFRSFAPPPGLAPWLPCLRGGGVVRCDRAPFLRNFLAELDRAVGESPVGTRSRGGAAEDGSARSFSSKSALKETFGAPRTGTSSRSCADDGGGGLCGGGAFEEAEAEAGGASDAGSTLR